MKQQPANNKHNKKLNRLRRYSYCKDTDKLPDGTLYESVSPVTGSVTGSARRKRKANSEHDFLKEFNTNSRSSKAAICMHLIMESISKATHDIRGFTEKKSCLLRKAREEKCLSRTDLKEKFAQYEKSEEDGDSIGDDDSITSLFRNCKSLERDIKVTTISRGHLQEELSEIQMNRVITI